MPYSQVVRMVNENLNRFAFLVTVIFVLIASSILISIRTSEKPAEAAD